MVQALAFAELFAGGILFLCGWKGYTPAAVVKGEAGGARPLGQGAATSTAASSPGAGAAGGGESAPGSTAPQQSAPSSPFGTAPAPAKAGALTWDSLRREIKAHKLTPAQVEADLKILTGKAPPNSNHPPAK